MNLLPGLAHVQCPVLMMSGAQETTAAIPAPWGRLVTFANAGRSAWRDEPAAAMALIRSLVIAWEAESLDA